MKPAGRYHVHGLFYRVERQDFARVAAFDEFKMLCRRYLQLRGH